MTAIFGSEVRRVKADVAVIGGGTAGLNTAIAAAEMGADVLIVDKAHIQRSGAIAGGIDHFFAYLNTGPSWDTRDAYLGWVSKVARGAANIKIHEKVFCDELELPRPDVNLGGRLRVARGADGAGDVVLCAGSGRILIQLDDTDSRRSSVIAG